MALGGVADHVHLLIDLPATLAISDLLKHVKGTSSHLVTQHLQPGQFFKWQGAYAAFSVDPLQTSTVIRYIVRQAEHHAAGTLIPAWELPPPSEDTSV
jgi:REP element-mobilizing transposase RayT